MKQQILTIAACSSIASAFTFVPNNSQKIRSERTSQLQMGLFDGVKDAFNAPPGDISAEKETPIDRWMGWNTKSSSATEENVGQPGEWVDFMRNV